MTTDTKAGANAALLAKIEESLAWESTMRNPDIDQVVGIHVSTLKAIRTALASAAQPAEIALREAARRLLDHAEMLHGYDRSERYGDMALVADFILATDPSKPTGADT